MITGCTEVSMDNVKDEPVVLLICYTFFTLKSYLA